MPVNITRKTRIDSPWMGVPQPEPLQLLVKEMRNSKLSPMARQKAMNLLNRAIDVMRTVKGRKVIIAYLSEQIELTRNELYPRRSTDERPRFKK